MQAGACLLKCDPPFGLGRAAPGARRSTAAAAAGPQASGGHRLSSSGGREEGRQGVAGELELPSGEDSRATRTVNTSSAGGRRNKEEEHAGPEG